MPYPELKEFGEVRKVAEEALEAFVESKIEDIYTPGSLHVVDVLWCLNEDGDSEWVVKIEEAAPEAYKLQAFVMNRLAGKGFVVRVETEW